MGAGTEDAGWSEPLVPPVPEKKKKKKAATSSPPKTAPATSSPAKDAPASPPAPPAGAPDPAPQPTSPEGAVITAQQLSAVVTAASAPPSGSQAQSLVLHAGRAAVVAGEKASAQLGRIVELTHDGADLGPLKEYAEKWNRADLSDATCGLGKDKLPVVDNSGPRSTVQHLSRLKRAMKEFDTAWHDANINMVGTLNSRKQLFEELLWEHRDLSEAFSALERTHAALPEASLEDLTGQIAALKAEKEKVALEHRNTLEAQRSNSAELKDQLVQARLQHERALKEAKAAGDGKVEEARKEFADATAQLRKELEEETGLLQRALDRNTELTAQQAELDRMVRDTDAQALKFFPDFQAHAHKKIMELRAGNPTGDAEAPWNTHEHLVALHARLSHMKVIDRHLRDVPEVAFQIFKFLWPGEPVPENLTLLAHRLKDAGKRFSEWKRSSARAGADAALRVACSWYEELDLDALHSLRGDAPTGTDPAKTAKRRDRAYRVAQFASTSTFIPPPADIEDELSDDEEDEETGEDEVEVPEEEADAPPEQARKRRLCPKLPLNPLLAKITHLLCITPPDPVLMRNNIVKFPRYAGWELYQYI
nr:uncharacterized protein LOC127326734 [Lolium perenne]